MNRALGRYRSSFAGPVEVVDDHSDDAPFELTLRFASLADAEAAQREVHAIALRQERAAMRKEDHYRVVRDESRTVCHSCGHGAYFTIVSGIGDEEFAIGTAWGDEEFANDVCDYMNEAYGEGWTDGCAQVVAAD